jgi:hypothetical protein
MLAFMLLAAVSSESARADVFRNVPEALAEGYQLVYSLPIEDQATYNITGSVPYSVDNSASITSPFDRIAYYLELDSGPGLYYAYASMDAFTSDVSQIGLPISSIGASFQRLVSNMNVASNSGGVTTGSGITTGNIEFWPRNYGTGNSSGVPGASGSVYDLGDEPVAGGDYGSFQIHNYGAGETILSYNQWGGEAPEVNGDVGIGTAPSGHPDWTFANNSPNYSVKNLQILVRPSSLSIDTSLERAVFQRDSQNEASVPISGSVVEGISSIEARAIPRPGSTGTATDWQVIDASPEGGSYAGELTLYGGWYDVEVRSLSETTVVDQRVMERVGVGEVFVTAGQSNSANHGSVTLTAADDRVSAFDLTNWSHADDPQPIATGSGGSPWAAFGDAVAADQEVPVGLVSVGWGGTSVEQWLPGGDLYIRLRDALETLGPDGARAVLWHQGETDNILNTSTADYRERLKAIIAQSRIDAGFDIPWGVAQASFVPPADIDQNIIDAQQQVAAHDPLNFVGALTDDLTGPKWRPDGIHFNEMGLREHAARWHSSVITSVVSAPDPGIASAYPFRVVAAPNPFATQTTIDYELAQSGHVTLEIFDLQGRMVRRLVDAEQDAGGHQTSWDGRSEDGRRASGIYFYRVLTNGHTSGHKLILMQ